MSRVFFLASNTTTDPYPVYPLGMAVVSAALAARGHAVRQFDFLAAGQSEAALRTAVAAAAPDYVCLSIRNIDNTDSLRDERGWYLDTPRRLVEVVRECTPAPVIVGGPAFSIMPEAILAHLGADFGIVGEGEHALPHLLDALQRGERSLPRVQRGLVPPVRGADIPAPRFEPELLRFYLAGSGLVGLQTKRGCPYQCNYCTYPGLEGHCFRPLEAEAVLVQLEQLQRDHAIDSFFFTDAVFNDDAGHYLEFVEAILRRGLKFRWASFFSPRGLTREQVALCKRAGLYAVELGTDAACDTTLRGLDKGFTFADVERANAACVAERVPCAHFLMFGGPDETTATVAEGLTNLAALPHCVVFAFAGVRILPGTGLYQRALRDGVVGPATSLLKPVYYVSPQVDAGWLTRTLEAAWRGHPDRLFPPERSDEGLAVMRNFGYRGIMWDRLVTFTERRRKSGPAPA